MRTVLVVEDERDIREVLRRYLERAGLSVLTAATGAEALRLVETIRPDLLLLDLGLPDIDGSEVLAGAGPAVPVIVLTAGSAVDEPMAALPLGADDCVAKPFSPSEMVLRVQALLGRGGHAHERDGLRSFGGGRLQIDVKGHRLTLSGRDVTLTPHEWGLLIALAGSPGRVFSRRELIERLGGYMVDGYERAIDSHVKNLRHKLGPDGKDVVQTVVGFGYRLGLSADG